MSSMNEHMKNTETSLRVSDIEGAKALYDAVCEYSKTHEHVSRSLKTLESAVRIFGRGNISVAFNGGKDATVVFYLTLAAFFGGTTSTTDDGSCWTKSKVHCVYLEGETKDGGQRENFEQVDDFVKETVSSTSSLVDCLTVQLGILQGIEQFIAKRRSDSNMNNVPCAFVMGTRRSDPHGYDMERFEPSSPNWPPFMRVNPILDWKYHDVWHFLQSLRIPFCSLYRSGYTSIGSVETTLPNPSLRRVSDDDLVKYDPAWMLADESLERAGRIKKKKAS